MKDRKAYNSTLRPVSKKKMAEKELDALKGPHPLYNKTIFRSSSKKEKASGKKFVRFIVKTKKGVDFIEGHPLYGKMIFRAKDLPPRKQDLMDRADALFSEVVRRTAVKENPANVAVTDILRCFICKKPVHWKEAHCMHCEPRICGPTRYSRINCKAGCPQCNGKPLGDRAKFRIRLDKVHGAGTSYFNLIESKKTKKWGTAELMELIAQLEEELKTLTNL